MSKDNYGNYIVDLRLATGYGPEASPVTVGITDTDASLDTLNCATAGLINGMLVEMSGISHINPPLPPLYVRMISNGVVSLYYSAFAASVGGSNERFNVLVNGETGTLTYTPA